MENNTTELVFVLDKSGSMAGLEADTIGGFNSLLEKQRKIEGVCHITTVLFSRSNRLLHDRIDIQAVRPLTKNDYFVGGCTALLDAVGFAIDKIDSVQKSVAEEFRAKNVMFAIITDGHENSSQKFTRPQIKQMIEQKQENGWKFVFLGANIDAYAEAGSIGISADDAMNFKACSEDVQDNFEHVSMCVRDIRLPESYDFQWESEFRLFLIDESTIPARYFKVCPTLIQMICNHEHCDWPTLAANIEKYSKDYSEGGLQYGFLCDRRINGYLINSALLSHTWEYFRRFAEEKGLI